MNELKAKEIYEETKNYAEVGRRLGISRQRAYQVVTGKQSPKWYKRHELYKGAK